MRHKWVMAHESWYILRDELRHMFRMYAYTHFGWGRMRDSQCTCTHSKRAYTENVRIHPLEMEGIHCLWNVCSIHGYYIHGYYIHGKRPSNVRTLNVHTFRMYAHIRLRWRAYIGFTCHTWKKTMECTHTFAFRCLLHTWWSHTWEWP